MADVQIKTGGYTIPALTSQEFTFWWGSDALPAAGSSPTRPWQKPGRAKNNPRGERETTVLEHATEMKLADVTKQWS